VKPNQPVVFFACPSCGRTLKVAERSTGLLVRCPGCGSRALVPGQRQESPPVRADDPTTPLRNPETASRP
jgi:DNA-directed RNA polymerase subunit RPC12/RpoP